LARVGKTDIAEFNRALEAAAADKGGVCRALHVARHHFVERRESRVGRVVLNQQASHLPHRRHGARGQHGAGHPAAQGEIALGDQINTDDDDGQVDELLDKGRGVAGGAGEQAQLGTDAGQQGCAFFPLALDRCLGGERLEGLETHQAFDQGGVALGAGAVGGFGQLVHAALHDQRIQHHDGRADHERDEH